MGGQGDRWCEDKTNLTVLQCLEIFGLLAGNLNGQNSVNAE